MSKVVNHEGERQRFAVARAEERATASATSPEARRAARGPVMQRAAGAPAGTNETFERSGKAKGQSTISPSTSTSQAQSAAQTSPTAQVTPRLVGSAEALSLAAREVFTRALNEEGFFVFSADGPPGSGKSHAIDQVSASLFGEKPIVVDGASIRSRLDLSSVFGAPPGYAGFGSPHFALARENVQMHFGDKKVAALMIDELDKVSPEAMPALVRKLAGGMAQGDLANDAYAAKPTTTSWVICTASNTPQATQQFLAALGEELANLKRSTTLTSCTYVQRGAVSAEEAAGVVASAWQRMRTGRHEVDLSPATVQQMADAISTSKYGVRRELRNLRDLNAEVQRMVAAGGGASSQLEVNVTRYKPEDINEPSGPCSGVSLRQKQ